MVNPSYLKRFGVYWVNLDPTIGTEVQKARPCVIVSPDSMNQGLKTVLIAPMTTTMKNWPFRVPVTHKKTKGQVMLDQIRAVSKKRLHKADGTVNAKIQTGILECLKDMFG